MDNKDQFWTGNFTESPRSYYSYRHTFPVPGCPLVRLSCNGYGIWRIPAEMRGQEENVHKASCHFTGHLCISHVKLFVFRYRYTKYVCFIRRSVLPHQYDRNTVDYVHRHVFARNQLSGIKKARRNKGRHIRKILQFKYQYDIFYPMVSNKLYPVRSYGAGYWENHFPASHYFVVCFLSSCHDLDIDTCGQNNEKN